MAEDKRNLQLESIQRANAKLKTVGFGNMGDSVERRYTGYNNMLGGGNDMFAGIYGAGTSFSALGPGMYYGTGPGYGDWSYGRGVGPYGFGGPSGPFAYLKRFSGNSNVPHNIIARCQMAYLSYGIVKNIIDLYADFACGGLEIVHEDESVQNFYETWAKKVDLKGRLNRFSTDFFLTGNVFIYRVNAKLADTDKRDMKRGKGAKIIDGEVVLDGPGKLKIIRPEIEIDPALVGIPGFKDILITNAKNGKITAITRDKPPSEFDIPENTKNLIPWDYTSLNPLQIEPRGKKFKGDRTWAFALDRTDTQEMESFINYKFYEDLGITQVNLPNDFKGQLKKYEGGNPGYISEIQLDKERLSIVQDKKFDYWDWSVPLVWPALQALSFKDILMAMDIRVATSVINTVTLWRLGDEKNNTYADDESYERLADMLQQPGQALNIIWNKDIAAQVIQANTTGLFDNKKFETAERDILRALGISEVMVGGDGGNFSNSYISVATVLEKLKSARAKLEYWLMRELKIIAEAMGFRKLPKIKWGRSNLTDVKTEQALIIQLMDRGVLSAETALKYFDEDLQIEVERQKREKKIAEKEGMGILDKRGPYQRPEDTVKSGVVPVGWTENIDKKKLQDSIFAPKGIGAPSKTGLSNGRPPGSRDSTKRPIKTVKPRGRNLAQSIEIYGQLYNKGHSLYDNVEKILTNQVLQAKGLKYYKQLGKEDKSSLESSVVNILSQITPDLSISEQVIANLSQTIASNSLFQDILNNKLNTFKQNYARVPTKEERKEILASTWALSQNIIFE